MVSAINEENCILVSPLLLLFFKICMKLMTCQRERLESYKEKCDQVVDLEATVKSCQSGESRPDFVMSWLMGSDLRASQKDCLELKKQYADEVVEHKKKLSICVIK
jgi:hypothetical protein